MGEGDEDALPDVDSVPVPVCEADGEARADKLAVALAVEDELPVDEPVALAVAVDVAMAAQ